MRSEPIEIRLLADEAEKTAAMALRVEVFVDEQAVPREEEIDAHDEHAAHFGAFLGGAMIGVARVVDAGHGVAKIGRVAVRKSARGTGVGRVLMERIVEWCRAQGYREAMLDAQVQVEEFYARLGFRSEGEVFIDAGIDHIRMRRRLSPSGSPA